MILIVLGLALAVSAWVALLAVDLVEAFTGRSLADYPLSARLRDQHAARVSAVRQAEWQARFAGWARWSA